MKLKRSIILAVILLAVAASLAAQRLKMGDELPLDSAVCVGKLDNGMTYYLRNNSNPSGMADFYIVYDVGAIQEEDSEAGLAHFLEHMAFNGTKHFPQNSMTSWLEGIGLQFGTNLNAATGMDMTYYKLSQVPLKRESIVDSMLLILHDWSGSLSLDAKEIDKERGVIIEERRQRNTPDFRTANKVGSYLYGETRYAHRDLLGSEEFLRSFKPQLLRDFYQRWYRPDLQAIVIIGDFNVHEMEAKLKKTMADIPRFKTPMEKTPIAIPDNNKPIVAIVTDPETQVTRAELFIKRPPVPKNLNNRVGTIYMKMLMNVATAMANNRYGQLMQNPGCPFTSAALLNTQLTSTCDALQLRLVARGDAVGEAFTSAYGELERIRRDGFTQEEFDFVRTQFLRSGKQLYETRDERKSDTFAQECMNNYVKNTPIFSAKHRQAVNQLMLGKMTLQEVNEMINKLVTLENNVLVISAPERIKESLPKAEQMANFFSWVRNIKLDTYEEEKVDKPLISAQIAPGAIVKKEKGIYGSTEWTLQNGIRVVALPTTYSRNQIQMDGQATGGLSMLPDKDYFTGSMLAQVANMSGLGGFNTEQLRKVLAGKLVTVQSGIGRFSSEIAGSSAKSDVETMLQLTYLSFMKPNFDRERFDVMLEANRLNLVNSAKTPGFVLNKALNKAIYGDNPRTQISTEETLKSIDFGKMPEMYRHFFTDAAGNYTFYFLGDIDLETLKPLVEKYLGGLPGGTQKLSSKDDGVRILSGVKKESLNVPMQTPKSLISFTYTGDWNYNQPNSLIMSMLSSCLQTRYTQTIREDKGGTYGVSVNGSLSRQPITSYRLNVSFQTDPAKVQSLVEIVQAELVRIAEKGPETEDYNKNIEYWRKSQPESIKNNQTWLAYLQNYYTWGEDWNVDYNELLKKVTPESVKELARKILDDGNLKQIVVSPEK